MQRGTHPAIHDILALRECFSNHPLGMNQLHALQMVSTQPFSIPWRHLASGLTCSNTELTFSPYIVSQKALSRAVLLTPYLPPVLLRYRLKTHTTVIHQLDKALAKLGIGQLTAQEVKSVSA